MTTEVITQEDLDADDLHFEYTDLSTKRIDKIEKIVRASFEYKMYILYLKNTLDVNRCAFYKGYSMSNGFSVEMHHSPFSLYMITETVANKHITENGFFRTMKVAGEVGMLHYKFMVGLVPLNPTAHELHHNGELPIHPDLVLGNWEEWYTEYLDYHSEAVHKRYTDTKEMQKIVKSDSFPEILQRNELKLELPDLTRLPDFNMQKMLTDLSIKRLESQKRAEGL